MSDELDEPLDDDVLASVGTLRACDLSPRRSRQLRRRCHAMLRAEAATPERASKAKRELVRQVLVPALGGAWCLMYLVEILRRTAAFYGYPGVP